MKKYILFIFLASHFSVFIGQDLPTIIPQSPAASSLAKYCEFPVSSFTGVPNISLPLMTVESGDISIPLQLNYNAAGFRVTEEASWVGLGWTLSTDAMISRTIHGVDDFTGGLLNNSQAVTNFYLSPLNPPIIDITGGNAPTYYQWICSYENPPNGDNGFNWGSLCKGDYSYCRSNIPTVNSSVSPTNYYTTYSNRFDWEPDAFYINFFGNNNIFVYSQDHKINFINKSDIEITKTTNGWKARTNDGFVYQFEKTIISKDEFNNEVSSEWYLTKIISPLGHEAEFFYSNFDKTVFSNLIESLSYSESAYARLSDICPKYHSLETGQTHITRYLKNYLERIEFDNGTYITFVRDGSNRQDLKNAEKLKYIRVYDFNNSLVREFELVTDYFSTNNSNRGFLLGNNYVSDIDYACFQKRLKLTHVIEHKGSVTKVNSFEYSGIGLPNKDSYKQDHWGFYNNNGNNSLIPPFEGKLLYKYSLPPAFGEMYFYKKYYGANRESDTSLVKACILTKINYPTGGYTSFKYEANDYLLPEPLQYAPEVTMCIGDEDPVYDYYDFSKDIRAVGSGNGVVNYYSNNVATDSITFPYPAELDVEGVIEAKIEIVVYATGSGDITLNSGMYATISGSNFELPNVYFNDLICTSSTNPCYAYQKIITLPENANGPITMTLTMPGATNPQTAVFTFSAKLYKLTQGNKFAGGLRIKRITHHDPTDPSKNIIKTYQYLMPYVDQNNQTIMKSSGILKKPLRYYSMNAYPEGSTSRIQFSSSTYYGSGYEMGNHIGYSKIIEYLGANGEFGKTESVFRNQKNILYNSPIRPVGVPTSFRSALDGTLYKKSIYDKENHLLTESYFDYVLMHEKIIKGINQDYYDFGDDQYGQGGFHYYPIYTRWEALISQNEKVYNVNTNNSLETFTHYVYSANLLPRIITTYTSIGDTFITKNYYPENIGPGSGLPGGFTVDERNILTQLKGIVDGDTVKFRTSEVIQQEEWKNNTLLTRQRTQYDSFNDIILPKFQKFALYNNNLETRIKISRYDDKGNIQEVEKIGDMKIAYLWSYNNSYPVIKAENANYNSLYTAAFSLQSNLQTFLTNSVGDLTTTQQKTAWRNFNNSLRSHDSLSNALISTYTFKPLIGITSETDLNGITTYYEYDELGRLKFVRNDDGNILKSYEYKYSQAAYYSAARSQAFTKNNCNWGYNGSSVTYSVPAERYVSLISQADADNKAQAEITQNGQNNANTNGTCTPAITISAILPTGYTAQIYATVGGSSMTFNNVTSGSTIIVPNGTGSLNITLSGCSGNHMYSLMGLASINSGCQGTLSNLSLQSSSYMLIISKL